MKKFSFVLAIIAGIILLSGCTNKKATEDNWSTIKEEKKVIVGLDDTFVPMGFRDKDGKLTGFDIDLATAVFKEYGINVEFQPIDWSMKEFELNNGTIDLIWNGYSKPPPRRLADARPHSGRHGAPHLGGRCLCAPLSD